MKRISQVIVYALLIISLLSGCEKDKEQGSYIKIDHNLVNELYSKAADTIQIGIDKYFLEAYLWRDFQPISPPNGKPLIAINYLIRADSNAIPSNIKLKLQYVIKGDTVWVANYSEHLLETYDFKQERVSRNGPDWGPHVFVNVVAVVTDTIARRDYFIKRTNAYINRTD